LFIEIWKEGVSCEARRPAAVNDGPGLTTTHLAWRVMTNQLPLPAIIFASKIKVMAVDRYRAG
jgi:hypothetical protein